MRSTTRLEEPISLSYHEMSLMNVSERAMQAPESKVDEAVSPMKSEETTISSVYTSLPLSLSVSEAALTLAKISSRVAGLASLQVRSTTDTSGVGTRKAMPVSLPLSAGMTLPTALAAPVEEGMMFWPAPRPPRQSLPEGPSTVFCVAVVACTVVMRPSAMPYSSWMILARGARQLVVHEALERISCSALYSRWLTPMTNIGASAEGAEMITFLAPPLRC